MKYLKSSCIDSIMPKTINIFGSIYKVLEKKKNILTVKAWLKLRREEKYYRDMVQKQSEEMFGNLHVSNGPSGFQRMDEKPTHGIKFEFIDGKLTNKIVKLTIDGEDSKS